MLLLNPAQIPEDLLRSKEDVLCFSHWDQAPELLRLLPPHAQVSPGGASTCFESQRGFDYIFLNIPRMQEPEADPYKVEIYFAPGRLLFFSDPWPVIDDIKLWVQIRDEENLPLEKVLYHFFCKLTEFDTQYLEDTEEEVANLEDAIADNAPINFAAAISGLRKKLLTAKRYYESLVALLDELEENQNHFLSQEQLRLFHFLTKRADRLYHVVLNLRDYVTQVREAYQAQMDIALNKTMKLFTVITAIFLPLSLIAAWYGMNLRMPEYASPYAYWVVIAVSICTAAGCILYFKKSRWF